MFLNNALKTAGLVAMIVGGLVLLAVIVILLVKFVFIRKSYERQIKDLDRKFSYLDALMIGQDSQYIKRLEMISRTNLLYLDIYSDYSNKFKHIYEIDDQYAKGVIDQLKNLVAAKQYRQIKTAINEGKKAVQAFEEKAVALDQELNKLIKPEEDSRQVALALKERLRSIKRTYNENISDLEPLTNTFNRLFDKLDKKFIEFETRIEGAEYDEANAILPIIDQVLTQLQSALVELPQQCVLAYKVIPEKIKSLKEEAEDLHSKDYPLHHLMLTTEFARYEDKVKAIQYNLSGLILKNVRLDADNIQADIDEMHSKFIKEVESKKYFNENCDAIYQRVLDLEKRFLRLCSKLPEMNRIYQISDEANQNIENLKDGINKLGGSKRSLDAYIHSSTPQAYSILANKLEILNKDYEEVNKGTQDFKIYIDSLKGSSEDAYNLVFAYYYRLRACEQQIKSYQIAACEEKYKDKIDACYALLNDIQDKIKVTPIDIAYIDEKVEELKTLANELFDDVAKDGNVIQMAESAILIANRDRKHQNDVHQQLLISEDQFFEGNFDKTYHDVVSLIKKRHVEDSQG